MNTSAQLLRKAQEGCSTALDLLFRLHMPALRRYARGRLPRWARTIADTTDLVQDALLHTFRRLGAIESRGERALQGYLRRAVDNRVRDELRRIGRRGRADELTDVLEAPGASPFEEAHAQQLEAKYRAALAKLRPSDRDLVVARVELGYTHEQLAVMTGRQRADSVRVALSRALHRLAIEMDRA